MKTQIKKHVQLLVVAAVVVFSWNVSLADDLNPPSYRGGPLSVFAEWQQIPGAVPLQLTGYDWVDDTDPDTTLYPMDPPDIIDLEDNNYEFYLPNWIDKLPVKYMRLQLTWIGSDVPPDIIGLTGTDGADVVFGNIVNTSPIDVLDPATGLFYQYYDIEFKPNPDQERWLVHVPDTALLTQAVVDTISTVPEPATMMLLGLGSFLLRKKRNV